MAIAQDMFYVDVQGNRKLRPFFMVLVSQNTCFKTQDILISEQVFALPVTLGTFAVKPKEHGSALVWSSLSESNNKGFEVQHSVGNPHGFVKIGFVDSKAKNGNSQAAILYSFEDNTPINGAMVYYRLKQIDMDGKSSYSAIRSIKAGMANAKMLVYPNPSSGSITIQSGNIEKQRILLLDQNGRLLRSIDQPAGPLKMDGLKTGIYLLKLMGEGGEVKTRKIIVH
jgi:hypothetical protein